MALSVGCDLAGHGPEFLGRRPERVQSAKLALPCNQALRSDIAGDVTSMNDAKFTASG